MRDFVLVITAGVTFLMACSGPASPAGVTPLSQKEARAGWESTAEALRAGRLAPGAEAPWEGTTLALYAEPHVVSERFEGRHFRELWVTVAVANRGPRPAHFGHGSMGHVVRFDAHRDSARSGPPDWTSSQYVGGGDALLHVQTLTPGEAAAIPEFQIRIPFHVLKETPPPLGRYYLTAYATLLHNPNKVAWAETIRVPAGSVELTPAFLSRP